MTGTTQVAFVYLLLFLLFATCRLPLISPSLWQELVLPTPPAPRIPAGLSALREFGVRVPLSLKTTFGLVMLFWLLN